MGPTRRFAPSAPGTVLTRNRNDSKDNLMNSSLRLQGASLRSVSSRFNPRRTKLARLRHLHSRWLETC
jgi:hypothetical protein